MGKKGNSSNTNSIVVKYKDGKTQYEALVKPGSVEPYRNGKLGIDNVLMADVIFSNASKSDRAKDADLQNTFGTTDQMACLKVILDKGNFSLTKKEIQEKMEGKRREILNYLHKYYWDPTKTPPIQHPLTRIENALEVMKFRIDPYESVTQQLKAVIKQLPNHLPVKPMPRPDDEESMLGAVRKNRITTADDDEGKKKSVSKNNK